MEVRKYFGHTCPELSAKWDLAITGLAPSLLQELAGRTGARPPLSSCGVRTNASEFSASYGCAHQSNPPTLSPGIGTWRKVRSRGPCRVRNRSHPPPPPRCISGKNVCEPSSFSFSLRVNRPRSLRLAMRAHTGVEGYLLSTGFAVRELRCNDPRRRAPGSPGPQEKLRRGWPRHAALGLGGDGAPLFGGWRRTSAGREIHARRDCHSRYG